MLLWPNLVNKGQQQYDALALGGTVFHLRYLVVPSNSMTYNLQKMQDRYRWTTEHASLVKEAYWQKGRNRLKDMVCKVSKKKPTDVIPWLSPDVHRQLLHHKRTNNGFLRRSTQSRLNKITGPKAGTLHTQGSILAAAIAKKMVHICFSQVAFWYPIIIYGY